MKKPSRRVALLAALVILVTGALAVVGYVASRPSQFEQATGLLPASTARITWTDWAGVREELGGDASYAEVADRDLTLSSLAPYAAELEQALGLSPMDAEWELLGQGPSGMVLLLSVEDVAGVADGFEAAGYPRPGRDALDGAVWNGGADLLTSLGLVTYELSHVAFLESEGLLVASDGGDYLAEAMDVVRGEVDGLDLDGLAPSGDPLAATAFIDDYACEALSMASADGDAQAVAGSLVEAAGGVSPLSGYLVALGADRRIQVVLAFEDDDQADRNLRARKALARADDPGQGVSYPEVFTLGEAETDGRTVVLTGEVEPDSYPMTNLAQGPVLLASC